MTVHICRDLLIGGSERNATGSYHTFNALMAFLQGVIGYTTHSSAGMFVPNFGSSQWHTMLYYSASWAPETAEDYIYDVVSSSYIVDPATAKINLGPGKENYVQFSKDALDIEAMAWPVGYPDNVNDPFASTRPPFRPYVSTNFQPPFYRMYLAIKSTQYPLANSGVYLVTSWSIDDNALIIDYRAGSDPPEEENLQVSLWDCDPSQPWEQFSQLEGNGSANGTYGTSGLATFPRAVLVSPSPLEWQLRLCIESPNDRASFSNALALSVIPGFSASSGDFQVGKFANKDALHLHVPQWFNSSSTQVGNNVGTNVLGTLPGLDRLRFSNIHNTSPLYLRYRLYAWGDDETGSCIAIVRPETSSSTAFTVWGQAEDEPQPEQGTHPVHKLFVVGMTNYLRDCVDWSCGVWNTEGIAGAAFSLDIRRGPISCLFAPYIFVNFCNTYDGNNSDSSIRFDRSSGPTPFLGANELVPVDLVAGTRSHMHVEGQRNVLHYEPRRLGFVPIARLGAAITSSLWMTVDDDKTWFHTMNGFYLPWGGVTPLP